MVYVRIYHQRIVKLFNTLITARICDEPIVVTDRCHTRATREICILCLEKEEQIKFKHNLRKKYKNDVRGLRRSIIGIL